MFLPAFIVTVEPGLINSPFSVSFSLLALSPSVVFSPPSTLSAFNVKPELLIMLATFCAVAILLPPALFTASSASLSFAFAASSSGLSATAFFAAAKSSNNCLALPPIGFSTVPFGFEVMSTVSTLNVTLLVSLSDSTTALVPLPSTKFTVS